MSTELERYSEPPQEIATRPTVDSWTEVLRPIMMLAEHVAGTEFVPRGLRGSPPATAAAMLYGRELGMGPMKALQNVHVIDGTPTLKPQEMRAMVLAAGHSLSWREFTKNRCVLAGRRRGETEWTVVEWSMQDARDMRLAEKPNWKRMPRQMLVARATGELCRMIFPDVIGGAYTPEEIADGAGVDLPADAVTAPEPETAPRRAKRKTPVKSPARPTPESAPGGTSEPSQPSEDNSTMDGPPLPEEIADAELVDENAGDGVSQAQLKRLHAFFSEHDITDRDHKLEIARAITGRGDLQSSTDLSSREAGQLIDTLARLAEQSGSELFRALDLLMTELGARAVTDQPDTDASDEGDGDEGDGDTPDSAEEATS